MKKLLFLWVFFALTLVACEKPQVETPTDEPTEEPKIEFQITSEQNVELGAEGGTLVIKYAITNPDESLTVTATADEDWLSKSDALDVPANEVHFIVAENESEASRTATVTLVYGEFSGNVLVEQKGAESKTPDNPVVEAVELPYLSGNYFGNYYGATENDYNYSLALSTQPQVFDIVTGEVNLYDGNIYLFLDLYASTPSDNYNIEFSVPEGTYILDIEDTYVAGTIGYTMSSFTDATDPSSDQYVDVHFVEGVVVVKDGVIEATLKGENGVDYKYICRTTSVDNSDSFVGTWGQHVDYASILTEDEVINAENAKITGYCDGDYYVVGRNSWNITISFLDEDIYKNFALELLVPFEDDYPVGEYPVSSDLDLEQMALPGFLNSYGVPQWSWLKNNDGIIAPLAGGKITFIDNGNNNLTVVLDLLDDNEHKITGEFSANLEIF